MFQKINNTNYDDIKLEPIEVFIEIVSVLFGMVSTHKKIGFV